MTSPRKNFGFSAMAARKVSTASAVRPAPSSAVAIIIAISGDPGCSSCTRRSKAIALSYDLVCR